MISTISEAIKALSELPITIKTEPVPLKDALDRVCAEDVIASVPVPSFQKSAYDGYALRSKDTLHAPVTLKVNETIPAGSVGNYTIAANTASRIMTGAPIPDGADAVIMHEKTEFTDKTVTVFSTVSPGNIVPIGEDVSCGTLLAAKGALISPAEIALLAGQGLETVLVYKKPVIGIITTGSELCPTGRPLLPGKIYNTNSLLIGSYIQQYHMIPKYFEIVDDNVDALKQTLNKALESCDAVLTTGGVSAGDYDYMPKVVEECGCTTLFHKLGFKPGGAMLCAKKQQKTVFCLSGNPGSAVVGLLYLGLPFLKRLCGITKFQHIETTAILAEAFNKPSHTDRILRGYCSFEHSQLLFHLTDNQYNGSVSSMIHCQAFAKIPEGSGALKSGTEITVFLL